MSDEEMSIFSVKYGTSVARDSGHISVFTVVGHLHNPKYFQKPTKKTTQGNFSWFCNCYVLSSSLVAFSLFWLQPTLGLSFVIWLHFLIIFQISFFFLINKALSIELQLLVVIFWWLSWTIVSTKRMFRL